MGDLACPVAFELARRLRKAPRAIAAEIVAALGPIPGITKAVAAPNGYVNVFLDRPAVVRLAARRRATRTRRPARRCCRPRRRSSSTRRSTRTRRPTSATCATPRSATRWSALLRHGGVPVEVQNYIDDTGVQVADVVVGFQHLEKQDARRGARDRRLDALRLLLLGSLRARHRVVRRRSQPAQGPQRDAARHRARRQRHGRARRLHRRPHRPLPSEDDGAAERRLRPADVGGRHPAAEVLGHGVRPAARERHDVQADRRQAGRLLGDADRGGSDAPAPPLGEPRPSGERRGRRRGAAREGHRPLRRHRHLRRQGHRLPVLEARPAREGLQLPAVRDAPRRRHALGHDDHAGRGSAGSAGVRPRPRRLQRHRYAPELPAEAAQAGAGHARSSRGGRPLDPLLLRDGGAVASHRARARLHRPGREQAVRRGVGPQGPRRQGRRPARSDDRQGQGRGRGAQPRHAGRCRPLAHGRRCSACRRCATSWSSSRAPR